MTKADIAIIVVLCIIVAAVVIAMIVAKIKGKGGCSCCDKSCSACQKKNALEKTAKKDGNENNEAKAALKESKCCAPSKANSACQGCPLSKNKGVCKAK